jgi:hypothetical protein
VDSKRRRKEDPQSFSWRNLSSGDQRRTFNLFFKRWIARLSFAVSSIQGLFTRIHNTSIERGSYTFFMIFLVSVLNVSLVIWIWLGRVTSRLRCLGTSANVKCGMLIILAAFWWWNSL